MKRYLALSLLAFATFGCDAMTAHTDVVARAGQHDLTVDETLELLSVNPRVPAQADVIRQLAGLWVDYTIMAAMVAEDSTLQTFDMEPLLKPYVEQEIYAQLRDQVMTTDTVISDEELAELYATEAPGVRLRARHILLRIPDGATEAERDSVMELAREIRRQAVEGADFSELARQYSADQGSAQQGGDLGWFERGRMVQPFEEAAFALDVGEVSEVVETPFGLHIIKLDDREVPALDEVGEDFRTRIKDERRQASLDEYVASLEADLEFEVSDGAGETVKALAADPSEAEGRRASRELITWEGGAVTAGELAELFQSMPAPQRAQFANMRDEQLTEMLQEVATNELVLADARERGITVPQAKQDSVAALMRDRILQMAQNTGLTGAPQPGETQAGAVERRVKSFLTAALSGQQNLLPLGQLSIALRQQMEWRINAPAVDEVVEQLEESRANTGTAGEAKPPATRRPDMPMPEAPAPEPDTAG